MAQKRMFSKDVVDTEQFYQLPFNSQLLYFHLGMHADSRGFVQPQKIVRLTGLKLIDLKPLVEKEFVIAFKSGVVVITHWQLNNNVREDRESPSIFKEEYELLTSNNNIYLLQEYSRRTPAQVRLGKDRLGEIRIDEDRLERKEKENHVKEKEVPEEFVHFKSWLYLIN